MENHQLKFQLDVLTFKLYMLFSYIVGHVPVNVPKKIFINEKIIKKIQNIRFFYMPYRCIGLTSPPPNMFRVNNQIYVIQ